MCKVFQLNIDGKWNDEVLRHWMFKQSGMGSDAGGFGLFQDIRLDESDIRLPNSFFWSDRGLEDDPPSPICWDYAPSPALDLGDGKGRKKMGGCLAVVWGSWAKRAARVNGKEGRDTYGRWTVLKVRGHLKNHKFVLISCYRPQCFASP
jgi:hypothetical protein